MIITMHENPEYEIVSSGLDWITSFNSEPFNVVMSGDYMEGVKEEMQSRGHSISKGCRMGFVGWQSEGCFSGFNQKNSLSILSSDLAREFGVGLLKVSQRVSRLDLQVTVDTGAERPCLSLNAYHFAVTSNSTGGRPREYKITRTHPKGDTLNVCKRTSDGYGRLYDWGAAHKQEEKHRFWRYEVETKRNYCASVSSLIRSYDGAEIVSRRLVWEWFRDRAITPFFTPSEPLRTLNQTGGITRPGVLAWFEDSVSITVARAIKEYGLTRVLQALTLEELVDIKPEGRQ